jgi:hypothetical protein
VTQYGYHRRTEPVLSALLRDAPVLMARLPSLSSRTAVDGADSVVGT